MPESAQRFGDLLVDMGLVTQLQVREALALQAHTGNRLGETLLSLGYLTRAQLQRALSEALRAGTLVALDRPPLGEILLDLKYLERGALEQALALQRRDGRRLGEILVERGVCTHQQIHEALGLQLRMGDGNGLEPARVEADIEPVKDGQRLMVVDDSLLACSLLEESLILMGYDVRAFQDPLAALAALESSPPHLVLTDLDMPGINGAELCRRIKEGPHHHVPVIILTANDAESHRIGGLRAGADDYVHKSVSTEELGARIAAVLRRTSETERIRRLFARYTSDAVVEEILRQREVVLSGEKREVTVLFADMRNFTGMVETLPADEVMSLLNEVLGTLADCVLSFGGTLDKFLGDGLMAVFGAPVRYEDSAQRAVKAALQMMEEVRRQNGERLRKVELGIGIDSGLVVAGSLGSARRLEYTCIGDTVNVASRLCALAGPGEILVGEATFTRLSQLHPFEALPPVKLKGKLSPVPLFRVGANLRAAT